MEISDIWRFSLEDRWNTDPLRVFNYSVIINTDCFVFHFLIKKPVSSGFPPSVFGRAGWT